MKKYETMEKRILSFRRQSPLSCVDFAYSIADVFIDTFKGMPMTVRH